MVAIMMVMIDGNATATTPSTILRLRGRASAQHENLQTVEPEKAKGPATGQRHWRDAPQSLGGHAPSPFSMRSCKIWMARST
eukprot:9839860-Lingulodinium_polyedra.AAC.1